MCCPPSSEEQWSQISQWIKSRTKKRVFISFDFDHDEDLRNLLVGQAKHSDTPFDIVDRSLKEALTGDWKAKIRGRIERADIVLVICGEYTHTATGVDVEFNIAKELRKPFFLVKGRRDRACTSPRSATIFDQMHDWTWPNLKALVGGVG